MSSLSTRKVSEKLEGGFVVIFVVNSTSITGSSVARLLIQSYLFIPPSLNFCNHFFKQFREKFIPHYCYDKDQSKDPTIQGDA